MKKLFEGSGVALVTPFKDGKVNYEKLGELIEWHIANKTDLEWHLLHLLKMEK